MKRQPYLVDYHTHNYRCGHAIGELREYVERAVELGFHEIGLSDHFPLFHIPAERRLPEITMEMHQLEEYVQEAIALKQEFAQQIDVKVGIEADYVPEWEDYLANQLRQYPFDYVLGSVHFIGEWDHSDSRCTHEWDNRDVDQVYRHYYALVKAAAESKIYDSIAHFDVIKRFNHHPTSDMTENIREALLAVKAANICVEVNTSGEFMPVKEIFPSKTILHMCKELDIPITVGSDSHRPHNVGTNIERIYGELRDLGFTEIAGFDQRRRYRISLL
ncbi:hypothetical protein BHU72_00665 [Desulfuribacillus stibiiarsenatis]|uniref:Histidinol-phosphatase n=1 Tax=Desulfuribacillus stibiiarsenatis TaxID=1390249 RepID=A0A1E5L9I7_9FIRM|nr:histidinol-phosphatase HisJ family protein [Desulfuribacillus stibiiarsenatis]OEH86815.1 hypothetical protein BHU72_00665 [Desulfuribacillus stibiiarsenatis]